jgi:hypothetical protein
MTRKFLSFFAVITFCIQLFAQSGADYYRSAANKSYWKNRKPYEGYWQQDIYYKIKASINEKTDILTGSEELLQQLT